ncbi:VTT domain-containing protein [Undibacterium sp. Dicai25W]|uniref:VTT domain-containing protein n=1 Tax=Undibacterium sp. Dicai25W TaxID=3413034 RepID=UPI003BF1513F
MTAHWLNDFFAHHSTMLIFCNVLLQQLGIPVPAVPTLMLNASQAKSLLALGGMSAAAVAASLIADQVWYQAGKIFGYKVLKLLCKMSINPGSCVNQTEARFVKWGMWSLVFGKFIPGFSIVAPPVAGALGMSRAKFLIASAIGAALWSGLALLAGYALQAQISASVEILAEHGIQIATVFSVILVSWLGWKVWQKKRFEHLANIPHISVQELAELSEKKTPFQVIDLRSQALINETGMFPQALVRNVNKVGENLEHLPEQQLIITFCACPADASAVHAAHTLKAMGFTDVRPLKGGFEALSQTPWIVPVNK